MQPLQHHPALYSAAVPPISASCIPRYVSQTISRPCRGARLVPLAPCLQPVLGRCCDNTSSISIHNRKTTKLRFVGALVVSMLDRRRSSIRTASGGPYTPAATPTPPHPTLNLKFPRGAISMCVSNSVRRSFLDYSLRPSASRGRHILQDL